MRYYSNVMGTISAYTKFILTLLTLAVVVFGFLTVQSLDRLRAVNLKLLDELEAAKLRRNSAVALPPPGSAPVSPPSALPAPQGPPPANARYFDPAAKPGGELRLAIGSEPPNLNALICNEYTTAVLDSLCNVPLAARDWAKPEGAFEPMLAESWSISPDHLSYRIKLRRGVLWHDFTDPVSGRAFRDVEVTARDFRFFFEVVRDESVNCAPLRVYYQDMEDLTVVDDREFVVKWRRPFYGSLSATLGMTPLPRHFYHGYPGPFDGKRFNDDHRRNRMLVGCGPYRFVEWSKNRRIVFVRNEKYFGAAFGAAPPLDRVIFEVIPLANTRFQALAGGKLDRLGLTPEQWVRRAAEPPFSDNRCRRFKYLAPNYSYIGYNQKNPIFRSKKVRQALTMLIDRERIRREVLHDLAEIAVGPFFPGSRYTDPAIKPWPFDPRAAKRLLAEEGWRDLDGDGVLEKDGRRFSFTMLQVANHPTQEKIFPIIRESLAAAGIEMRIQMIEWSVYLQRLETRNYDACSLAWATNFDPDPYQVWHSSSIAPPGSNHIGYRNVELDKLIEEMRRSFDLEKRAALARRIGAILHDEQPYTFLFNSFSLAAVSGTLHNVRVFPASIPDEIMWKDAFASR